MTDVAAPTNATPRSTRRSSASHGRSSASEGSSHLKDLLSVFAHARAGEGPAPDYRVAITPDCSSRDSALAQATVEELSLRPQPPRCCQTSRRSSYTVIGSPERPRPWPRTTNPSLAASWRDAALSPSSM